MGTDRPSPTPAKRCNWHAALFIVGAVLILGIAAAFFVVFRQEDRGIFKKTTPVAPASVNTAVNTNTTNADDPSGYDTDLAIDTTPVTETDWKKTTYQRGAQGFTLETPSAWSVSVSGNGLEERQVMISAFTHFAGSEEVLGGSLSLHVSYFMNSEPTLREWVTKHSREFTTHNETITATKEVGNALVVYTEQTDYPTQVYAYGYILRDDTIYELKFTADEFMFTKYDASIKRIWNSLKFIEQLPIVTVKSPDTKVRIATGGYDLDVAWLTEPEAVNFDDPLLHEVETEYGPMPSYLAGAYYKAGTVTNGTYAGDDFIVMLMTPEGPAFTPTLLRAVYDPTTQLFTYLEDYSDDLSYLTQPVRYDTVARVPDLTLPSSVAIPNSTVKLVEELRRYNELFSANVDDAIKLFTDTTVGDVYLQKTRRCMMVRLPDGLIKLYRMDVPFTAETVEGEGAYQYYAENSVPEIVWNDTTENTVEYTNGAPTGFCDSRQCNHILLSDELSADELVETGRTNANEPIYEYRDRNHDELKQAYETYTETPQFDSNSNEVADVSYDEFAADHPIFFWKSPLNYYVRFEKASFLPMVECGKPVIYLYPTETTEVNVQVAPTGGFSVTDPVYPEGGWTVVAQPDGQLTTLDGAYYPYLFWEGVGFNYEMPDQGFVVAREDVEPFLTSTLARLGLNEQEANDFKDFWVAKLQEQPYYFITFVDQTFFNQLAPLTVTPRPDTTIRVFMDYRGLDAPISVEPLPIRIPVRHGFTVVEWGGALHD